MNFNNKICFFFLLIPLFAISQIKLSGSVIDDIGPTAFANVVLMDQGGNIIAGTITQEDGVFQMKVTQGGSYILTISFVGLEDWSKEIVLNKDTKLEPILLKQTENNLDEVLLVAKKKLIERKVDRIVFNVENNVSASGGDAIDALSIAPGVRINDNEITMIGKSGMKILIDDRIIQLSGEELVNFLKTIPSDAIKKIEVITNPPAKYEAEGNSGLINIVYKKGDRNSWNNSVSINYVQADFANYRLNNNFSYQKNKLGLLFSVGGKAGNIGVVEDVDVFFPEGVWQTKTNRKDAQDNLSGRLTLDYEVSENSTIGVQYLGNIGTPDIQDKSNVSIFNRTNTLDSLLITNGMSARDLKNHSVNTHFISTLDSLGRKISLDLDYFNYTSDWDRDFRTESYSSNNVFLNTNFSANSLASQNVNNYSARIDVEHPLKIISLSYGAKISFINNNNSTRFFDTLSGTPILDPQQTDEFEYKEKTQAVYINSHKNIGEKWEVQLGLRLENTDTEGISITLDQTNTNNYTQLFPTFYLSYKMNDVNSFSFNYGRRINRPNYSLLNPFRWYINSQSYGEGNPFLEPSFSNNFEFNHIYKGKLTTNIYASTTQDGFGLVTVINENTNEQIYTRQNFYKQYDYGISESYTFNKIDWWQSHNNIGLYYVKSTFSSITLNTPELDQLSYYLQTNNVFLLNKSKTLKAQVNYWYNSSNSSNLFENSASYKLDVAIKYSMLNNSLQVSLGGYDLFRSSRPDMVTNTDGIRQNYNFNFSNRFFRASLTYTFGNKKIRVKAREFGNKDEKRRANN